MSLVFNILSAQLIFVRAILCGCPIVGQPQGIARTIPESQIYPVQSIFDDNELTKYYEKTT